MSRHAFEFLVGSPLWASTDSVAPFAQFSDDAILAELARYREHALGVVPEGDSGLSVTVGARQGAYVNDAQIKRSVIYFDRVFLPDPLFPLTEATLARAELPFQPRESPISRASLYRALEYMRALLPVVRAGRVQFIPSTHALEPPKDVPLLMPDDAFRGRVPELVRPWFYERTRIRKLAVDERGRRLVLSAPPDKETRSIAVDFGQLGGIALYEFMNLESLHTDGQMLVVPGIPDNDQMMQAWLVQSVNAAAGDFLQGVAIDVSTAQRLQSSYVTSCEATAALLAQLGHETGGSTDAVLSLEVPTVDGATYDNLETLILSEDGALQALRIELRNASRVLAAITDTESRKSEASKLARHLTHDQVAAVERTLHGATRKRGWDIPIALTGLAAGAFGFFVGGPAGAATTLTGLGALGVVARDHLDYRTLPGYFLWKLQNMPK